MYVLRILLALILLAQPVLADQIYIVKSGDSLIKIAHKFGIKPSLIKQANPNINWLKIKPNDKIIIPTQGKRIYYTVQKGDSLIKIAKKLGYSYKEIKRANPNVDWLKIKPNDKIFLPIRTNQITINKSQTPNKTNIQLKTAKKEKPKAEQSSKNKTLTYTIKPGDSLIRIAKKLHYSYKQLKEVNSGIDWSKIRPGQVINLPKEHAVAKKTPRPGEIGDGYYIVARGDTLRGIANRFGLSLQKLRELNPKIGNIIKPGDLIVIPKDLTEKIILSRKENLFIPPKYLVYSEVYRVKPGDSLWKIAKKFNTSIDIIKTLNDISGRNLRVGQVLFVPSLNLKESEKLKLRYSILNEERHALIKYAERFIGTPYRFGGNSLRHGIDCSAFVQKIYSKFNIRLPRTAEEQYRTAGIPISVKKLQPGDLLFFHTMNYAKVTHVAIYIGNGKFIHAAGRRSGVKISRFDRYYWKRFVGAKRILGVDTRYAYIRGGSG
ncbi:LysM peptidoglycan-binding domain-containing protein [Hippea sp. KM1]|uniref:LysM peptidoglycan-binding domain-containing protein n=1 Tax=Hippea sp. KM1 TaxID=944481 RepID=UPI00046CF7C6|nr:LysM peptidoglycan-binding domain-containing protein [Hippea sp. KM1]